MAWYYNDISGEMHHATNPVDNAVYSGLTHTGIHWHEYATEQDLLHSVAAHHWKQPTTSVAGGVGNVTGVHNPIAPITDTLHFLTSPDAWIRGGEILAGAILLIAGVMAILKVPDKAAKVGKVAALL